MKCTIHLDRDNITYVAQIPVCEECNNNYNTEIKNLINKFGIDNLHLQSRPFYHALLKADQRIRSENLNR
jgi:hypothetical protein